MRLESRAMSDKPIALDPYEALSEAYAAGIDAKPHNAYCERMVEMARRRLGAKADVQQADLVRPLTFASAQESEARKWEWKRRAPLSCNSTRG